MATGVIEGRRVCLRPAGEDDLDLLAAWFADPGFIDGWSERPLTREEVAAKYVGRRRPAVESFVVMTGKHPVGYAQYWRASPTDGGIDLILVPHARGRGLGPDAADAPATHLLRDLNWSRVTVDPAAGNARAVSAWAKAGFQPAGYSGAELVMERR